MAGLLHERSRCTVIPDPKGDNDKRYHLSTKASRKAANSAAVKIRKILPPESGVQGLEREWCLHLRAAHVLMDPITLTCSADKIII